MAVPSGRRGAVTALIAAMGLVLLAPLVATAAHAQGPDVSATYSATGTLELRASLGLVSDLGECPPGVDGDACAARTGQGSRPGLGSVSETYIWSYRMGPPTCPSGVGKPLATTGRLVVVGKGEILFALADGARCIDQEPLRNEPQDFTITGGTGTYDGASGSGTLERALVRAVGTERWIGTLGVPGLEFDMTPPRLSGATSKTVRAPRAPNASGSPTTSRRATPWTATCRSPVCRGRAVDSRSAAPSSAARLRTRAPTRRRRRSSSL